MKIESILIWISTNREWVFSGIGVAVLGIVGKIFDSYRKNIKKQNSSIKNGNIQIETESINDSGNGNVSVGIKILMQNTYVKI